MVFRLRFRLWVRFGFGFGFGFRSRIWRGFRRPDLARPPRPERVFLIPRMHDHRLFRLVEHHPRVVGRHGLLRAFLFTFDGAILPLVRHLHTVAAWFAVSNAVCECAVRPTAGWTLDAAMISRRHIVAGCGKGILPWRDHSQVIHVAAEFRAACVVELKTGRNRPSEVFPYDAMNYAIVTLPPDQPVETTLMAGPNPAPSFGIFLKPGHYLIHRQFQ